jgi:hypothetical protein
LLLQTEVHRFAKLTHAKNDGAEPENSDRIGRQFAAYRGPAAESQAR